MPSPDITPYVDLTLNDKDPQDIFDTALLDLQTKLPGWVPREGNTEVLLLEALALQAAETVFALNRVPSAVVEAILKMYGIERDIGAQPTVNLTFNLVINTGYTIPAGVTVRLNLAGGLAPVDFTTATELTINPGSSSGTIAATGDRFTAEANGATAGTAVELLDSVIYVDTVTLGSNVSGGRDPETDDDYLDRGVQRFSRLSETLVLPSHFTSYALEQANVERAFALDNYTPANDGDNNGPVGNDAGHITVAVYGDNTTLTAQEKTDLEVAMEAIALGSLDVHVIDPTITTVNVTVTVKRRSGYQAADVQANVVAALSDYLKPASWEWGTLVRRNELIGRIDAVEGVDYVETLTTPAADQTLAGVAPLANAGTLTVTVT